MTCVTLLLIAENYNLLEPQEQADYAFQHSE